MNLQRGELRGVGDVVATLFKQDYCMTSSEQELVIFSEKGILPNGVRIA